MPKCCHMWVINSGTKKCKKCHQEVKKNAKNIPKHPSLKDRWSQLTPIPGVEIDCETIAALLGTSGQYIRALLDTALNKLKMNAYEGHSALQEYWSER